MNAVPKTIRRLSDLAAAGLLPSDRVPVLTPVATRYAVALTPEMAGQIDPENPHDPIARQFVPNADELLQDGRERVDPIGDDAHSPVPGIVHRYPDRALLKVTTVCAVYCRFCFRRETVGDAGKTLTPEQLDAALDYIEQQQDIWEVILTGGDPFMLSPRRLEQITRRLAATSHVKIVRVHTRIPIVDPSRVSDAMVRALTVAGKATYIVLHANHAREWTPAAREACARLIDAGIPMLSQSVLLAGVNDTIEALTALMRSFVENRIKPYYLHHADLAPGTGHFRTTIAQGQELMRQLRGRVSGLSQPTYVLDIPDGYGKSPIGPSYLSTEPDARQTRVEDYRGAHHIYPPE